MNSIKITSFQNGQELLVYLLIKKVYDEFVSIDYTEEGNRVFYDWIEPSKMAERQQNQINILIATIDSEIVGMIEIRDNNKISLLFVDKKHHGLGVAKKLFQEALKKSILRDANLNTFLVNASPYSIPVYRKLGFIETDVMQEKFGIKYLPMAMTINKVEKN